jgi:hypothetical protein
MYFLLFILLLLALFVLLLFYTTIYIKVEYSTNDNRLIVDLSWLNSLIHAKVYVESNGTIVSVYLKRIRIFSKLIKPKGGKKNKWKYIKALDLNDSFANVYYGLDNPFSTGIVSGIIQMIQFSFKNIQISQFPDFLSVQEYVRINAGTELNPGKTLAKLMRIKLENKRKRRDLAWSRSI